MNINELTLAQVKEIVSLFGNVGGTAGKSAEAHPYVGKYVILRCYGAGVHAGVLVSQTGDCAVLADSRRLWRWKAVSGVALSGLAMSGLEKTSDTRVDTLVPHIALTGVIETIPCSEACKASILAHP